jgi:hypothetical protein
LTEIFVTRFVSRVLKLDPRAMVYRERGDLAASQRFVERALKMAEDSGNLQEQARALDNLGVVVHLRGDAGGDHHFYRAATTYYRRGVELHRRRGEQTYVLRMELNLAQAYIRLGRDVEARALIRESLRAAVRMESTPLQALCVQAEGDRRLAVGETDVGLALLGVSMSQPSAGSVDRHGTDRILGHASLPSAAAEQGMARGRALDFDTVVQELLADDETSVTAADDASPG